MKEKINRSRFWGAIGVILAGWVVFFCGVSFLHPAAESIERIVGVIFAGLLIFLLLWASLAVSTKRWHDMRRSAMWNLLWFIPYIGPITVIVWLGVGASQTSRHRR